MASILVNENLSECCVSQRRLCSFEPSLDISVQEHQTLLSSEALSETELWALWYTEKANERIVQEASLGRNQALEELLQ